MLDELSGITETFANGSTAGDHDDSCDTNSANMLPLYFRANRMAKWGSLTHSVKARSPSMKSAKRIRGPVVAVCLRSTKIAEQDVI